MENQKIETKTGDIQMACERYCLGKNKMRETAALAGAVVRIGRRYLINFDKVDAYMDAMSNER